MPKTKNNNTCSGNHEFYVARVWFDNERDGDFRTKWPIKKVWKKVRKTKIFL